MTTFARSDNFLHIRQVRIEKTSFFFLDKEAGIAMMQRDARERIKAVLSVFAGFALLAIRPHVNWREGIRGGVIRYSCRIPLHANLIIRLFSPNTRRGRFVEVFFFRSLDP
jgi:hypothetical protein